MKVTSKHADATLAKLASVMERNTTLATGSEAKAAQSGPVATYTPSATPPASARKPQRSIGSRTSGIRLQADDNSRIRQIIQAGLELQETLAVSDVIRLALAAYDPKRLTADDIAQLRAKDGRSAAAKSRRSPHNVTAPQ